MILYLTENIVNESVSSQEVMNALANRQGVVINYNDETSSAHMGRRYIEPYVYGLTKAGNPCVRAYQYYGDTKRGVPKWKLFRLDRISTWEPTQETFELEPQARGWAAQAYNDNGDGSMSAVYKTVDLGDNEQMTDLDKLRAKTRQLQNSKPLTIDQFKDRLQYPEERNKPIESQPEPAGPINGDRPNNGVQSPITNADAQQKSTPVETNGQEKVSPQQPPIEQEPQQSGPITSEKPINAQESKPEELMSNDKFQEMLKKNLEITNKEKEKALNRKNNGKSKYNQ